MPMERSKCFAARRLMLQALPISAGVSWSRSSLAMVVFFVVEPIERCDLVRQRMRPAAQELDGRHVAAQEWALDVGHQPDDAAAEYALASNEVVVQALGATASEAAAHVVALRLVVGPNEAAEADQRFAP
jgi:hypothetical protein